MNRRLIITFDEETSFTDEYGTIEVIYNKSPALALGLRGAGVKGLRNQINHSHTILML